MLIRIVKMEFDPEKVNDFLQLFEHFKTKIKNSEGCLRLELLNDLNKPNVFFTYSYWKSAQHLDNYRHSQLFEQVWSKTKILFNAKPQAWSVKRCWSDPEEQHHV